MFIILIYRQLHFILFLYIIIYLYTLKIINSFNIKNKNIQASNIRIKEFVNELKKMENVIFIDFLY